MSSLVAGLLYQAGSFALRQIGNARGGKTKAILDTVANVVESTQGKNKAETEQTISDAVKGLPPENRAEIYELQVELEKLVNEREKNQQDHDTAIYTQEQETHRTEAQHGTDFVKETRPWIARTSFKATMWYVGSTEFLARMGDALDKNIGGADWQIAAALLSPCLGYMGMRTIDAFSKWKSAPLSALKKLSNR